MKCETMLRGRLGIEIPSYLDSEECDHETEDEDSTRPPQP